MLAFLVLAVSAVWPVAALENGLGLTPAMGWMQRDGSVECAQTEGSILSVGLWITRLGLDIAGYDMVTIGGKLQTNY
jgi:hypothetical protein